MADETRRAAGSNPSIVFFFFVVISRITLIVKKYLKNTLNNRKTESVFLLSYSLSLFLTLSLSFSLSSLNSNAVFSFLIFAHRLCAQTLTSSQSFLHRPNTHSRFSFTLLPFIFVNVNEDISELRPRTRIRIWKLIFSRRESFANYRAWILKKYITYVRIRKVYFQIALVYHQLFWWSGFAQEFVKFWLNPCRKKKIRKKNLEFHLSESVQPQERIKGWNIGKFIFVEFSTYSLSKSPMWLALSAKLVGEGGVGRKARVKGARERDFRAQSIIYRKRHAPQWKRPGIGRTGRDAAARAVGSFSWSIFHVFFFFFVLRNFARITRANDSRNRA